jgi:hypothetical protein
MNKIKFFLAHEFNPKEMDDLRNAIESVFDDRIFTPWYPDSALEANIPILHKIGKYILSTEFGIYIICSSREGMYLNPNVILELGIAIGANKDSYVVVEKNKAKEAFLRISDLAGFDRIEYSTLEDLKSQLKSKIVSKYGINKELEEFWLPFINEGGKIVVGAQTIKLKDGTQRNIVGKDDDLASTELHSFLLSVAKSSIVKSQQIKVQHLPMPLAINREKHNETVEEYINSTQSELFRDASKNFVLIGTPTVNPATELILAKLNNLKPFDSKSKGELKTAYLFNDPRRDSMSTFYENDRQKTKGIWKIGGILPEAEFHHEGRSCGLIIKTELEGKKFVILSGFNGVATRAAVELLTKNFDEVNFINTNIHEMYPKGILYDVRFEKIKERNKPFDLKLLSVSLIKR